MKLINMYVNGEARLGILTERGVTDTAAVNVPGLPTTMMEAVRMGREKALPLLSAAVDKADTYLAEA